MCYRGFDLCTAVVLICGLLVCVAFAFGCCLVLVLC